MATIDLGKIKLVWRGTYAGGTAYTVDDVVQHTDSGLTSSFICTTNSTGNAPSTGGSVHSSWAYLAKGGVAGTDVGTTLTTQGDILYRDGSGLQRLAKGTAGKVLQMNTAANAPEWGTVSSDYVKIHSSQSSSSSSGYHDYVHFSDTYQHYMVTYADDGTASGTSHFIRVGNGSIDTGSNYRWQATYASNSSTGSHGSTSDSQWRVGWSGDGSGYVNNNITYFLNCRDSSQPTTIFSRRWCKDHGSTWLNITMGGQHDVNGVVDRFRIYNNSGNITIHNIAIWGMKT